MNLSDPYYGLWLARAPGRLRLLLFVTLFVSAAVRADEISPPAFRLITADGRAGNGPIMELREDGSSTLGGDKPMQAKGADIISLRRMGKPLPQFPAGEHVVLTNGDRIPGKVLGLANERLNVRADVGTSSDLALPLTAIAAVWFASPENADEVEKERHRITDGHRQRDRVVLRNGDAIEGTLSAVEDKLLRLDTQGKDMELERAKTAFVALSTELARPLKPRGRYGFATLANGARLSLTWARLDGSILVGQTLTGGTVRVPVDQLIALDTRQGRAIYLSDVKPLRYEHTPYFGVCWPWVADGSVVRRDLRLGGSTFDKGVGMHSASRLTFDLTGSSAFEAVVGLDEQTGRKGDVIVRVLVDGKPQDLGWDGRLTGQSPPRGVRLATTGGNELTLVVEFGAHGDVGDHVNWADARIIK